MEQMHHEKSKAGRFFQALFKLRGKGKFIIVALISSANYTSFIRTLANIKDVQLAEESNESPQFSDPPNLIMY